VLLVLLAVIPSRVSAQPAPEGATPTESPEPAGYREAIDEAIAEHSAARYAEARALFTRAHALQPSARTLRGIGMTEFELRNYVEAARLLQEALISNVRPLEGELRTATEALLERTRGFIGRYTLTLTPADLQLYVDGGPARIEADRTLALTVGDHSLHAKAQGYVPVSHTLRVNGGEALQLNIALEKERAQVAAAPAAHKPTAAVTPTSPTAPRDEDSASIFSSPWFWTAAAVVVVGAGVGVGIVLLSEDAETKDAHGGSTGIVLTGP
jgi:hypothetical protein